MGIFRSIVAGVVCVLTLAFSPWARAQADPGLVAYYPLDTDGTDHSGNGYDLTNDGTTWAAGGTSGGFGVFAANAAVLNRTLTPAMQPTTALTLSLWAKTADVDGAWLVYANHFGGFGLSTDDGKMSFTVSASGGTVFQVVQAPFVPTPGPMWRASTTR